MSHTHISGSKGGSTVSNRDACRFFVSRMGSYKTYYGAIVVMTVLVSYVDRSLPILLQQLTDALIARESRAVIQAIFISIIIYRLIGLCGWRVSDRLASKSQSLMLPQLYNDIRYRLQHHSQQFFVNTFAGKLTKNISKLVRGCEDFIDTLIFNILPMVIGMVIMLGYLYGQYQIFAWIITIWIIIYAGVQYVLYRRHQSFTRRFDTYDSKFGGYLADTISNHHTIQNFAMIGHEYQTFQSQSSSLYQLLYQAWNKHNIIHGINSALILTLQSIILYIIITGVIQGTYSIGVFVMIQTYLTRLFEQMFWIGQTFKRFFTTLSESTDMLQILYLEPEIQDQAAASILQISQAHVQFQDISFAYQGRETLLDHFNLSIPGGQKIGIVGYSGGGKTTIIKLLMRSYDLQHGAILIDGQNIAHVTQDSLRGQIAFVSQDPILFHRSLADNIGYGRPDADLDQIIEASRKVHCHDFITKLSHGYDTLVGERGVKLSGGERQRIAIARAILADRPILIMDEATSSLDTQSEYAIQQAMKYAMQGKTTIVIAHRLSTLLEMDRIIVIDQGKIVQDGHHQNLISQQDGIYANLRSHQQAGYLG